MLWYKHGEAIAPHGYQLGGVDFLRDNLRSALFVEMGLGKTVTVATAVEQMLEAFEVGRVLIVAPKAVAEQTWTEELGAWAHLAGLRVSEIRGNAAERLDAGRAEADVYLLSREHFVEYCENFAGRRWKVDAFILDESSGVKDRSTKRFKAANYTAQRCRVCYILTATPSPNSYEELFPQIYLLDHGERLGRTLTAFRDTFFDPDKRSGDRKVIYSYKLKPGAREQIEAAIGDICLTLRAADHLSLPPLTVIDEVVDLPPPVLRDYEEFEREAFFASGFEVTASTAAVLSGKLGQWAQGAIYTDGLEREVVHLHDAKLDRLEEIVAEHPGENFLVAYSYRHDIPRLLARFPYAKLATAESNFVARWNAGEFRMLIVHPASAGHGLNMQKGGRRLVFFGLTWSLELYQQIIGRLHRQGQQLEVFVHRLVANTTLDSGILRAVGAKARSQSGLLEALKQRAARWIN
jgi:SNF2 family DNA or RNA helicase